MASKRKHNDGGLAIGGAEKQARTNEPDVRNEYCGFSLQTWSTATEPIIPMEDGSIRDQDFFTKYVAKRRPCIINALPELPSGKIPSITVKVLKAVAGDKVRYIYGLHIIHNRPPDATDSNNVAADGASRAAVFDK